MILGVEYAGTGCPAGSVSSQLGDNATVVNLSFDNYVASAGPGTKPADHRKNCNVNLKLHFPQGYSYTVATTDFRGYVDLDRTCSAQLGADYWFSGEQDQVGPALFLFPSYVPYD